MLDLLKDIVKLLIQALFTILVPIGMVVGGGALLGLGLDNDWTVLTWIGAGLLIAGLVWGAILFLFHGT